MLSLLQLVLLTGVTVGGLLLAYTLQFPLAAGFSLGVITLILLMLKKGVGCRVLIQAAWLGITRTKEVVWILVLVGIIIPAWMASGTIPYMIELGLSLVNPVYFLVSAFLMTSIISLILGTSLGSLSAVGIPLMGVASYLHIPLPLVAGASSAKIVDNYIHKRRTILQGELREITA